MIKTVFKYGIFGLVTSMVLFLIGFLLLQHLDYSVQEVLGYASMLISLSFVFFGIKHFRDKENGGKVSFGKALWIGLLIAVITGLGTAIIDYIYTTVINPDFAQEYLETTLGTMKDSMPAETFEVKKAELEQQMEQYGGSGFMAFVMFASVVLIGFVVSLISALVLQRK